MRPRYPVHGPRWYWWWLVRKCGLVSRPRHVELALACERTRRSKSPGVNRGVMR